MIEIRLSRDDILKADDSAPVEVDVPEWGGSVLVRGMTGKERDEFETAARLQQGRRGEMQPAGPAALVNVRAKLVARCVVDDDGNRLFTAADVAALGDKNGAAVDRVFQVAARLSGMGEEDVEEVARDFGPASGEGSSSPSPPASARQSRNSSPRRTAAS